MRFGITELIIILVIVILLFGTKKVRSLGGDLASALKDFRNVIKDPDNEGEQKKEPSDKT